MSFEQVLVFANEPPTWDAADAISTTWESTCRLSRWRGGCGKNNPPPLMIANGWRRLMACLDSLTQPATMAAWSASIGGGSAASATARPHAVPFVYLSTDAPALQQLTLEAFPDSFRVLPGMARPSWEAKLTSADYLKAVADFEALRVCDTIVGVASSSYANMAVGYSLTLTRHVDPSHFCGLPRRRQQNRAGPASRNPLWLQALDSCVLRPPANCSAGRPRRHPRRRGVVAPGAC
eukprot:3185089-Prymnesium_polylepis.1